MSTSIHLVTIRQSYLGMKLGVGKIAELLT